MRWIISSILLVFLIGCSIPLSISTNPVQVSMASEKKIIESLQTREEKLIVLAFYKAGLDMFEIASELKIYSKTDLKGFIKWLKDRHPFSGYVGNWLDKNLFNIVENNYELLDDIYNERDNIELYRNDLKDKEKDE